MNDIIDLSKPCVKCGGVVIKRVFKSGTWQHFQAIWNDAPIKDFQDIITSRCQTCGHEWENAPLDSDEES
jgi:hypothetical protein